MQHDALTRVTRNAGQWDTPDKGTDWTMGQTGQGGPDDLDKETGRSEHPLRRGTTETQTPRERRVQHDETNCCAQG
jgi:hypothetical protein